MTIEDNVLCRNVLLRFDAEMSCDDAFWFFNGLFPKQERYVLRQLIYIHFKL